MCISDQFTTYEPTDYLLLIPFFAGGLIILFYNVYILVEVFLFKIMLLKLTVLVSEPDFPYLEALAPFQPLAMKAVHCPIDTSLNFTQANKLIRDLKPGTLVLPESYTVPPISAPHRVDLVIETDKPMISFKRDEVLTLPLKRKQARVELRPELAEFLLPTEVRTGVCLATVTGRLEVKDNKYALKVCKGKIYKCK